MEEALQQPCDLQKRGQSAPRGGGGEDRLGDAWGVSPRSLLLYSVHDTPGIPASGLRNG